MQLIDTLLFSFIVWTSISIRSSDSLDTESIIGGYVAPLGVFRYQVSIKVFNKHFCGGGIIDEKFVVTAAHCVTKRNGDLRNFPYQIVGGTANLTSNVSTRVVVNVEKVYVPKVYVPQSLSKLRSIGDIAVLQLAEPLDLESNPNLSKLRLPKIALKNATLEGEKAVVTGFGWDEISIKYNATTDKFEESGKSHGIMKVAQVKIITNEECQKTTKLPLKSTHLCGQVIQQSANKNEGVCAGDSGSPLVYKKNILIGVVSTSPTGCRERVKAAVYTKVAYYTKFIKKIIEGIEDDNVRSININF